MLTPRSTARLRSELPYVVEVIVDGLLGLMIQSIEGLRDQFHRLTPR
jgi:hypothetical protein